MFDFDQSLFVGYIRWVVTSGHVCVFVCVRLGTCLLKKTAALCWVEETDVCKSEGYAKLAPPKTAGTEVTLAPSVWAQVPTDTHTQEQQWNYFFMLCLQLFIWMIVYSFLFSNPTIMFHHSPVSIIHLLWTDSFQFLQRDTLSSMNFFSFASSTSWEAKMT